MELAKIVLTIAVGLAWLGCTDENAWKVHDMDRPVPEVVTPGEENHLPPSDAIVLFDGKDPSAWIGTKKGVKGFPWKVENGYMEVLAKSGAIQTKLDFASCQFHIEWATPEEVKGDGQKRGNSGLFFMSKYEVQMLDSYNNRTYADGQAAALYGQKPPMVNASRKPGQWQTYDVIFHAPKFEGDKLVKPATITVFHNGVLVQDHYEIKGITHHKKPAAYEAHPERMPIQLQDHGDPMRFRNIWIRELEN